VYNRDVVQSRAVAVYATSARGMRYSGADIAAHTPLPPLLERIRGLVEARLGARFGTVMLNRYADGDVYIGRHSDTRENRIIASLSLGAERTFVLTPRLPPGGGLSAARKRALERRSGTRFLMAHGSMVVMQGRAGRCVADGRPDTGLLEGASTLGWADGSTRFRRSGGSRRGGLA
jgi:alkylated DNA repair dioxygenase AlkB